MSTTNGSAAKYNILERTKRTGIATTIDESKINPELLKQLEEDSSDDEDFIPDISSSMNEDENDHDDDDGSSDSSDDSSESENENEDKMNSDERSTSEIRGENDDSRLNGHNEDTVTSISKSSTTKRKSTSRKSTGSVVKKGSKAKKKAKSKIQLKYKEIDEEALKILKSFKNVPKVSPTNQQRQTPSDAKKRKSGTVEKEDRSMIRPSGVNTGPYVQRVKQKLMHDSSQLSEYYMCVVKQSETASESNTSVAGGNLVETSGRYKSVVPRERSFPIERKDEPWICCFCSNKANFMDGIGELYGPYRVSDDLEADIVFDATKGIFHFSLRCYIFSNTTNRQ